MAPFGASRAGLMSVAEDDIPDSIVDNFEDADADPPGPYGDGDDLSDYYNGSLTAFNRSTDTVAVGNHACSVEPPDEGDHGILSQPDDGLPRYPEQEDTVKCLVRADGGDQIGLLFNGGFDSGDDTIDCYLGEIYPVQNEITIYRYLDAPPDSMGADGDRIQVSSSSVSLSSETWYWLEVDMVDDSGNVEARVYDYNEDDNTRGSQLGSTSGENTDISVSNVGVGPQSRNSTQGWVDEIEIV